MKNELYLVKEMKIYKFEIAKIVRQKFLAVSFEGDISSEKI